eukprot:364957-Chlamydomonas_euryale.AAC.4
MDRHTQHTWPTSTGRLWQKHDARKSTPSGCGTLSAARVAVSELRLWRRAGWVRRGTCVCVCGWVWVGLPDTCMQGSSWTSGCRGSNEDVRVTLLGHNRVRTPGQESHVHTSHPHLQQVLQRRLAARRVEVQRASKVRRLLPASVARTTARRHTYTLRGGHTTRSTHTL